MHIRLTLLVLTFVIFNVFQGHTQGIYSEDDISAQGLLISAKKQVILGKTDKAIEIYKKLLADHNESVAAYELSRIYGQKLDFTNAINYAKKAHAAEPSNKWYIVQYAELLSTNNQNAEAGNLYKTFTNVNPDDEYYYLQASFQYLKADMAKEAIRILDQLEQQKGVSETLAQRKFEIYDVLGKEKEALKELQKLSKSDPTETRYLHNIAGYLRSMGKQGEANKVINSILKIDPNDETAILIANSSGKNKDANYLRSLVPIIKDERIELDKKILELIPYLEDFASKTDPELGAGLLDIAQIMDENYPDDAKVKSILGDIHFYSKNWKEAVKNYKASLDIDKSIWAVWTQLLVSLSIDQDFEMMEKVSEDAIDVYPNQALAYLYNGLALIEMKQLKEAEMSIREAGMIGGTNSDISAEVSYLMSRINLENKVFDKAFELINQSLNLQEKNPRYLEQLGDINFAMEDIKAAKDAWQMALKAGGNPAVLNKKISGESTLNN